MVPTAFSPIASHLWQSTLFAAAAALLTIPLRRKRARVRYALWLTASYKFLLPFSWLVSIGQRFEWRPDRAVVPQAVTALSDLASVPTFLTSQSSTEIATHGPGPLVVIISAAWMVGFAVVVSRWLKGWLRVRAIVRYGTPLPLHLPIEAVCTPEQFEPGVFGIFRPVLLLPKALTGRLSELQLTAVVAHELYHVRWRDNLAAAVHMLVEALFWFHPLVWWLEAQIIEERERACDEEVLRTVSEARVYAETILKVCEFYLQSPLACLSGVLGSDVRKRVERIMRKRLGDAMSTWQKSLLITAGALALALPIAAGALAIPKLRTQSSADNWEKAAGGKMTFDVASVKRDTAEPSSSTARANVNLGNGDFFAPTGGLYLATNWPLLQYMNFAYKLTPAQDRAIVAQSPKWLNEYRYDIQARASGNPTKDQYRLMMQALLVDRFKLAFHYETKQLPVFALVLDKSGKLGPQLRPHPDDSPCSIAPPAPGAPPTIAGGYPEACGAMLGVPSTAPGRFRLGARDVPFSMIVDSLFQRLLTGVDRPVLDKTGLIGTFDFTIEFTPPSNIPLAGGAQPDPDGPTFNEALKNQLGLKLEPQIGPTDIVVIDRVDQPTEN